MPALPWTTGPYAVGDAQLHVLASALPLAATATCRASCAGP